MPQTRPPVRPYLKWAGGKRQLLPEIRARLPRDLNQRTYYEPFVGAGAVLLDLTPHRAVVNDHNAQLILTYRAVRDDVETLIALLEEHRARHSPDRFYEIRAWDREPAFDSWSDTQKAARLIYLNKTCFNGLYRVNASGLFNVPCGSYKHPAVCEPSVLRAVSAYLAGNEVTLMSGDFSAAVAGADRQSFVYLDPPYHSLNNTNFTGYQADGFGEGEQRRLREVYADLTARGARCLLSNSDTPFIRDLYRDYTVDIIQARRTINSNIAGRGAVNEVLVCNW